MQHSQWSKSWKLVWSTVKLPKSAGQSLTCSHSC